MTKTKYYRTAFVVKGRGRFPLDMLRYDNCMPATGTDWDSVMETVRGEREVRLVMYFPVGNSGVPTNGRWASFGWEVTHVG